MNAAPLQIGSLSQSAPQTQNIEIQKTEKLSTEQYIKKYFSDEPILIEVARCESHFRQIDEKGEVLRGEVNGQDRGVMQINEYYHSNKADELGFDINTVEGNAKYARYLFNREGLRPWKSSAPCWKKTQAYSDYEQKIELAMK